VLAAAQWPLAQRGVSRTGVENPDPARRLAALEAEAAADPARAPLLHTRLARLHEQAGRSDAALCALEAALALDPGFLPALVELAGRATAAGQPTRLGDALSRAAHAEASPSEQAILYELAAEAVARAEDAETAAARYGTAAACAGAALGVRTI